MGIDRHFVKEILWFRYMNQTRSKSVQIKIRKNNQIFSLKKRKIYIIIVIIVKQQHVSE